MEKSEYVKIYFNHRFLGNTFELNFNDLFEEKNNFIYFKIFFDEGSTDLWKFGKPFLIKYFFSYDFDKKTISYYNINKNCFNCYYSCTCFGLFNFGIFIWKISLYDKKK